MCSIPGLPTPGSQVYVLIARVNLNPTRGLLELWVNLDDERKDIHDKMRGDIQTPQRKFSASEGTLGDLCLVCISDTWHRARILSAESDTCSVSLIDQGQPHVATRDALAWGPSESFLPPPETESCILANVLLLKNELPERVAKFLGFLPGKRIRGLVHHVLMPDRIILLEIPFLCKYMCKIGAAEEIDVGKFKAYVQNYLHAVKGDPAEVSGLTKEPNLDPSRQLVRYFYPELSTGTFENVNVTNVTDPENIFCELLIFSKAMKLLSDQLRQHYEESSVLEDVHPRRRGDPCAASGSDGRWRRSLLEQDVASDDCVVGVFHVDEGRAESVNIGDVRPLPGMFIRMPVVTYLCSLSGLKATGREWTADETDLLKSLLLNQTVTAKFDHYDQLRGVYQATLYAADGSCINDVFLNNVEQDPTVNDEPLFLGSKLIMDLHHRGTEAEGLLGQSRAFAVGTSVGVNVSSIESLQRFWCQTTESADSLDRLTQDLQNHYATSAHPQPLVNSIYAARNPDDGMWCRAKIIVGPESPLVDLRFIDCGRTGTVPLRDLRLLDPAFLKLDPQAVQCCLFGRRNPTDDSATARADDEVAKFRRFVESSVSSGIGLKCVIKDVTSDGDGRELKVVDIESGSESACRLLESEDMRQVLSDGYDYATSNIDVGDKEKVLVTSSENFGLFYCQLCRNSRLVEKIKSDVAELVARPRSSDRPLGLGSACLVRYDDDEWYRGRVVEVSPKPRVHLVDYGDTLVVDEADVRPFPPEVSNVRSVPVQAVPLGLFKVPAETHRKLNQWFMDHAVGHTFTMSVAAKGEGGTLLVELFDRSVNVNVLARKEISKVHNDCGFIPQVSKNPPETEDCSERDLAVPLKLEGTSPPRHVLEQESLVIDVEKASSAVILEHEETSSEDSPSSRHYSWPNISGTRTTDVYASCIVGPEYFWCQYSNQPDLAVVSRLAQEAGQTPGEAAPPEPLEPGSPCLARFSGDDQWYRAQVLQKTDVGVHVLFVDYGNESDIDIGNVKSMPPSLLGMAPQAFLCRLSGYDESEGSWGDEVYDDFYNVLVDKLHRVTVLDRERGAEGPVPQYKVKMVRGDVVINDLMQKHWKPSSGDGSEPETESLPPVIPAEDDGNPSEEDAGTCSPKRGDHFQAVYATCIAEPCYFWCQLANEEDLHQVSQLAQEAGRAPQDETFLQNLGSRCLALFPSDNQWYRARVVGKTQNNLQVVFVDYGNESEVDLDGVRPLTQSLLEMSPRALLCRLNGFDESKGSWDDKAYDDFYSLLVDKPLGLTVVGVGKHPEIGVPHYEVEIECDGTVVNAVMEKHWNAVDTSDVTLDPTCQHKTGTMEENLGI
ncbi:tudor domain-containing 6-like [Cololabis saira]|uniref:tudor domain-containing 6-like n=1 Tax=Cololabis saira TaxID=129043 RepID=UPI002AD4C3C1|nr:tudor domain-containing 6-like [Cololabis saira]